MEYLPSNVFSVAAVTPLKTDGQGTVIGLGFWWALIIVVLLVIFLLKQLVSMFSGFENLTAGQRRAAMGKRLDVLHALNSGARARFQGRLSDYSGHFNKRGHNSRAENMEGFAGSWSDAGPGHYGPNLGAQATAFFASQAASGEGDAQWAGGDVLASDVTQTADEANAKVIRVDSQGRAIAWAPGAEHLASGDPQARHYRNMAQVHNLHAHRGKAGLGRASLADQHLAASLGGH